MHRLTDAVAGYILTTPREAMHSELLRQMKVVDAMRLVIDINQAVVDKTELHPNVASKLARVLDRENPLGTELSSLSDDNRSILVPFINALPFWLEHAPYIFTPHETRKCMVRTIRIFLKSEDYMTRAQAYRAMCAFLRSYNGTPPQIVLQLYVSALRSTVWASEGTPRATMLSALDMLVPRLTTLVPLQEGEARSEWFEWCIRVVSDEVTDAPAPHRHLVACWEHIMRQRIVYLAEISRLQIVSGGESVLKHSVLTKVFGCPYRKVQKHLPSLRRLWDLGCPYQDRGSLQTIARHVLWQRLRDHVRVRPYALHWQECTAISQCADGGAGRRRDREAFEEDMCLNFL